MDKPIDEVKDVKQVEHASDKADETASSIFEVNVSDETPLSDTEKAMVRRIHKRVLPFVLLTVFIQYADKAVLGAAAVLGMMQDTQINGTQYSILGSIFYVGFLAFQFPNSYFLTRVPSVAKYLGIMQICWGIVVAFTAMAKTYSSMVVVRILLGLFEAATYPSLMIIINTLYRRREHYQCFGIMWMSNGFAVAFANLLSFSIGHIQPYHGISAWQWNYVILGAITVTLGACIYFLMPDDPLADVFQWTEEERKIAEDRLQDSGVVRHREVDYKQYWEAFTEWRFWLIGLPALLIKFPDSGLINFGNPFVQSFGFDALYAILLQLPVGVMVSLSTGFAIYFAKKTNQIIYAACICLAISFVGCLLLTVLPQKPIKLLPYYLTWCYNGAYAMILTTIGTNTKGYSKKVFTNSTLMVFYTIGAVIGPLIMEAKDAPKYVPGMATFTVAMFVCIVSLLLARWWMARRNYQRRHNHGVTDAYVNMTDTQDENFKYRL
ncbi:major facilitator superfamily domain-containing protein [Gongronella butleri]|nr:major facilitator superfamily domain-containing protein [Gongronella butleri]